MYRNGEVYDTIAKVIVDIYIDYDLRNFPIDEGEVCRKMGVALVPYSIYNEEERSLFLKRSKHGFFDGVFSGTPTIYFNDALEPEETQRFTIFHEIKHFVFEDVDEHDDDLADYFARYFMCPVPYFLLKDIDTQDEIISCCGLSKTAAANASSNIINRKEKYGYHLFDYEVKLIEHLEPVLLEVYPNIKEETAYEGVSKDKENA
jgi:Zn-dependent peptidase ImmA (M78 family)